MTYSRSSTQNKQKIRRRSRTRLLLLINGILLIVIVAVVAFVWQARGDTRDQPSEPSVTQETSHASPTSEATQPQEEESEPSETAATNSDEEEQADEDVAATSVNGDSVTLALVGDILPAARVLDLMNANGFDYPFRGAKSSLEAADIAAGNLETPITTRGVPAEDKQYVFRGTPDTVPALKEAGFDYLSLANNHTLDYGWDGLSDTMDYLDDADIKHAGSGSDDREAFAPAYIETKGITVGFVSVTSVVPEVSWKADRSHPGVAESYSPDRAVAAIQEAKENADIVVVMVHWGKERSDQPIVQQKDLAHRLVDAGADLIIGSHPHVLQGFESYKDKWIAYSLGNFVFSTTTLSKSSETGVLKAQCGKDGKCNLKFEPMFATNSQPAPMEAMAGQALLARLSDLSLSFGASVKEDGSIVANP